MALIKCPECGKEISDKASNCIGCGFPLINAKNNNSSFDINDVQKNNYYNKNWKKMRKIFGIFDFCFIFFFMYAVLTSNGGIEGNTRVMAMCWFLAWCGILNTFFYKKRGATIASIVFLFIKYII